MIDLYRSPTYSRQRTLGPLYLGTLVRACNTRSKQLAATQEAERKGYTNSIGYSGAGDRKYETPETLGENARVSDTRHSGDMEREDV